MRFRFIAKVLAITAIAIASVSPAVAEIANYELSFHGLLGPSGTGSFRYDDTPGAEWMSDMVLDFGVGLRAVIHTEYDPAVLGYNEHLFLFEIFSNTSPFGPHYYQAINIPNVALEPLYAGIASVIEGDGFSWIDFEKNAPLHHGSSVPFIDGPFYRFDGPNVAGDYHYGTISLSQVAVVPVPAAVFLLASALTSISVLGLVQLKSTT